MDDERRTYRITVKGRALDLSARSHVMGVLNVTPDSFSDGGRFATPDEAADAAMAMLADGADIIDIGGESTRPRGPYGEGARPVTADEEIRRVLPVIERLAVRTDAPISIDTTKAEVAEAALSSGAGIVNDISGLRFDPRIAGVAARHRAPLVLMHIRGTPDTMQADPSYHDVVTEVREELAASVRQASAAGVKDIIVDPGLGFGKTLEHNLTLIRRLGELALLGRPVLVGPSRKGFIGAVLGLPVEERVEGTAAAAAAAVMNGASIVRVHDVRQVKRTLMLIDAVRKAG
ncbi:MAG: dihydropteroate synthase [Bacteroidetes bacterium]|nr:MAG: dihydropteroate synthase [Bacteroidota bacterium]